MHKNGATVLNRETSMAPSAGEIMDELDRLEPSSNGASKKLSISTEQYSQPVEIDGVDYPYRWDISLTKLMEINELVQKADDVEKSTIMERDVFPLCIDLPGDVLKRLPAVARVRIVAHWLQLLQSGSPPFSTAKPSDDE